MKIYSQEDIRRVKKIAQLLHAISYRFLLTFMTEDRFIRHGYIKSYFQDCIKAVNNIRILRFNYLANYLDVNGQADGNTIVGLLKFISPDSPKIMIQLSFTYNEENKLEFTLTGYNSSESLSFLLLQLERLQFILGSCEETIPLPYNPLPIRIIRNNTGNVIKISQRSCYFRCYNRYRILYNYMICKSISSMDNFTIDTKNRLLKIDKSQCGGYKKFESVDFDNDVILVDLKY